MRRMKNPPHPGEVLDEYLSTMSIAAAAQRLDVARSTLSRILAGRSRISLELALRIGAVTRTSAEMWAEMQMQYDLHQIRKSARPALKGLLAEFDRETHGGEVMVGAPAGVEAFSEAPVVRQRKSKSRT